MDPRTVVAYRHRFGKRLTNMDKEVVCVPCHVEGDSGIVLHSDNGLRIKAGAISCALCKLTIKVGN